LWKSHDSIACFRSLNLPNSLVSLDIDNGTVNALVPDDVKKGSRMLAHPVVMALNRR
jgi:hypothetical protein